MHRVFRNDLSVSAAYDIQLTRRARLCQLTAASRAVHLARPSPRARKTITKRASLDSP